jgi:hypothetical protein
MSTSDLTISAFIDCGSSLTKCFFLNQDNRPEPLAMEPEVGVCTMSDVERREEDYPGDAKNAAWIKVDEEIYAVGLFARDKGYRVGMSERKWEDAAIKVLVALALIHERLERSESSFAAIVGVLLPQNEHADKERLIEALSSKGKAFVFRGKNYSIDFKSITTTIEGAGLFAYHAGMVAKSGGSLKHRTVAIVMMGHRNLSVLTVEGGGLSSSHSSCLSLGFSQFVEECRSKLAGNVSEPYLSCAIATGLNRIRSKGAGAIDIEKPAQEAREGYLALVKKELKNLLPEGEADVIICGGASKLIYEDLKTWLKKDQAIDSVSLAVGLTEKLVDLFRQHPDFQPEYQNSQDLAYPLRFADCFGAFNAMCMYNSKKHKSNNGAARVRQNAA